MRLLRKQLVLGRLTSEYMHFRLFSTSTEGGSEGLAPGSSESDLRKVPVHVSYSTKLSSISSPTAGGKRSSSYELTAAGSRFIRSIDKNSAEHVTTIFDSARSSSTATFSGYSSLSTCTMSSEACPRERASSSAVLPHRKFLHEDGVSECMLALKDESVNRCGAGSALGSMGRIDARRRREEESAQLGLSS